MAFIPHTPPEVAEMLSVIGAAKTDDLFSDIPADLMLKAPLDIPTLTEYEVLRHFEDAAAQNRTMPSSRLFLGAGAYDHYIPAAVKNLISRGEFMTCYTPYQAEVSQGTLQVIFEFQSHICALTGLEVANASMYDGATALAEAIFVALRHNNKKVIYLPELVHPAYAAVVRNHMRELDVETRTIPHEGTRTKYKELLDSAVPASAVVVANPNCLGGIENIQNAKLLAEKTGGLLIAVCNPTSLAVLAPPGEFGADIAVGEAQPLGIPLQYGGPYCGFMACKRDLIRKMPGRIVGRTTDKQGRPGFTLTLQTREQHIRRDKATSNICTNQGLFATMATMYMTFVGKHGLIDVAETCCARTHQLADGMIAECGARLLSPDRPYFHEVALVLPVTASEFLRRMRDEHGIIAGFDAHKWFPDYPNVVVACATETKTSRDVETYVRAATAVLPATPMRGSSAHIPRLSGPISVG